MIKVNILGKAEGFKLPTVLGMDLTALSIRGFIAVIILWYVADYAVFSTWNNEVSQVREKNASVQNEINQVDDTIKKNAGIKAQIEEFKAQFERLKNRREQVDKIFQARSNPYRVLERLARNIPEDAWFESIRFTEDKKVILEGAAISHRSIGNLMTVANESSYFGKSLYIKDTSTVEEDYGGSKRRVEKFVIEGNVVSFDPWGN